MYQTTAGMIQTTQALQTVHDPHIPSSCVTGTQILCLINAYRLAHASRKSLIP